MFVKHAFNRARAVTRDVRISMPVTRSRNRLVAVWRREPLSGRLELKWQSVDDAQDAVDLPSRRGPANRPDVSGTRRRSPAALDMQLTRKAAA